MRGLTGEPGANVDELANRVVAAVLGGDREAFRTLIERESTSVVRICHRILGNLPDAEDAAQEVFVTAYRALGTWRGDGSFGAWLGRIAVRVAQRQARRRGTLRQLPWIEPPSVRMGRPAEAEADALSRGSPVAMGRTGGEDPAAMLMQTESEARLRAALAALEDPYREVLALRYFADLSLEEIAGQSGRPLGTVKTHLRRGLLRLREELGDER